MEATVKFPYQPLPKQNQFHSATSKYRLYVGGMGSGKTMCGATEAILQSLWYKENLGLVGRMTYGELRDTTQKEILNYKLVIDGKETSLLASPLIRKWNSSENTLTFYNGSQIFFRALDDAFHKIKSLNLGWFYIDEMSEANDEIWLGLCGRLRRLGVPHKGWGTSNAEGRDWMWKRWVAQKHPDYFLVHAPSAENIHLPRGYVQDLIDQYPPEWVKRYVDGSFDTFEGLIYSEFNATVGGPHVCDPFDIPDDHYRFVALDHGFRNPTAALWMSVDRSGNITVYDEFYQNGLLVSEIAEIVKTKTKKDLIRAYLIDPSCGNRQGNTGRSVIDEFEEHGIYFEGANNEVRAGINHAQEYFHIVNGKSKVKIFSTCKNLIRELQTYKWKDLKIGDSTRPQPEKPVKRDDHACFVAGTMVQTYRGPVPIEDVNVSDYVLTRYGYRKVEVAQSTGFREVFEYDLGRHSVVCTPNHPIYTENRGFVRADSLILSDILCILKPHNQEASVCGKKQLDSTDATIDGIPSQTISATAHISSGLADTCTGISGNSTEAKYLSDGTFITKMATAGTINSRIWNYSPDQNTFLVTERINLQNAWPQTDGTWRKSVRLLKSGTQVLMDWNGTVITAKMFSVIENSKRWFADFVRSLIGPKTFALSPAFAPIIADLHTVDVQAWTISRKGVRSAINSLRSTNTLGQSIVRVNVLGRHIGEREVFNLKVDGGEYFANGILSHNCDTFRYGCTYVYDTPNLVDKKRDYRNWAYASEDAGDNWMAA